jgi:cell division protein FtsI/penicillin-binding protein 2
VAAGLLLFAAALAGRLVQLQIFQADELQHRASQQHRHQIRLTPRRGEILDREGRLLAVSVAGASVGLRPRAIPPEERETVIREVARVTGKGRRWLAKMVETRSDFFFAARHETARVGESLRKLDLPGVEVLDDWRREYPHHTLAAGLLGGVRVDGDGSDGLEYLHDARLSAPQRVEMILRDGFRVTFRAESAAGKVPPNLELALDARLQATMEEILAETARTVRAKGAIAVAMDPRSGEILAMASHPGVDLMAPRAERPGRVPIGAVELVFEPGSVMKALTVAAALEAGALREDERINLGDGRLDLPGRDLVEHDKRLRGRVSLRKIMALSSNVGAARIALRLDPESFHESLLRLGVGRETSVDLPTEGVGQFRAPSEWTGRSQAMIAIGQEVSSTPLGLLTSYAAIANDGLRPLPRVARAWIEDDGLRRGAASSYGERVMSSETARITRSLLEAVVREGTGRAAAVPGYRVAGKTGTAQKSFPGEGYRDKAYVSTFVGFAPLPRPEVALVVVIDEPRNGYYASEVAAPAWSRIMGEALRVRRVPPDGALVTLPSPLLARGEQEEPSAPPKEPA